MVSIEELREAAKEPGGNVLFGKRLAGIEKKLVAIEADWAKHDCGGALAGALTCKACQKRRATVDLPRWQPRVVTPENLAYYLAEYDGTGPAKRAEEERLALEAYERDKKRICRCGHPLTSHGSRIGGKPSSYMDWGVNDCSDCRYAYYQKPCGLFHEAQAKEA